jgi:hypothetical protein
VRGLWRRLGPRYGVSLGLVLAVTAIVLIARIGTHSTPNGVTANSGSVSTSTPSGEPDDGDPAIPSREPPTTSPGAPTASDVALDFAKAWLHHDGVTPAAWRTGVVKHATDQLAAQFADVDPGSVPADRVTGALTTTPHDAFYVDIGVPTDEGLLTLGVRFTGGKWLVDSVDWSPA